MGSIKTTVVVAAEDWNFEIEKNRDGAREMGLARREFRRRAKPGLAAGRVEIRFGAKEGNIAAISLPTA